MPEVLPKTSALHPAVAEETAASHVRWPAKLFSFPVMCVTLLTAVIFAFSPRGIAESDIWWHLRNARSLLQYHALCSVDTYTFTAAGSPWINFEWLSEVPYYFASTAGLKGILMVYSWSWRSSLSRFITVAASGGADCKDAAIVTLGAICLGGGSLAPRMLLFGWLCLMGLLLILDHFKRTGRGLWLMPPLFALWINLHGSWVLVSCSGQPLSPDYSKANGGWLSPSAGPLS